MSDILTGTPPDLTYSRLPSPLTAVATTTLTLTILPSSLTFWVSVNQAVHHLAGAPLGDAAPTGQMLTGDHRVVGHEVARSLLSWADAEGRRSLHHARWTG